MSHSQVAHRWFHQIGNKRTNDNAYESGNMFYNEKIIYSYGKHFALAIRFDNVVLFNSKGYSNSTSKHQSHVRYSIDHSTHETIYVPFKEAYRFDTGMKLRDTFKCIDFQVFVRDFEGDIDSLKRARKPEIYLSSIRSTQKQIQDIFDRFRGAKTFALKSTKGLRKVINFEFTEEVLINLKNAEKARMKALYKKAQKEGKKAQKELAKWENGEKIDMPLGTIKAYTGINTFIRVKNSTIETSMGMRIDLNEGLRVFNLWKNGKALGVEINTKDGHNWKCSRVNGIIKFGCHEVEFNQAERILTPHL